MGHLERGEKNVSITSIVRVSDALGITLSELFSGVDGGDSLATKIGVRTTVAGIDRSKLIRELAALERCVVGIRQLATVEAEQPQPAPGVARTSKAVEAHNRPALKRKPG
jgi:hypothetical protein